FALAAPDAAKIEPQDREPALGKLVVEGVYDLVVHGPTVLRVGMEHQRDRGCVAFAMLIAPLQSALRAVHDHFGHRRSASQVWKSGRQQQIRAMHWGLFAKRAADPGVKLD